MFASDGGTKFLTGRYFAVNSAIAGAVVVADWWLFKHGRWGRWASTGAPLVIGSYHLAASRCR